MGSSEVLGGSWVVISPLLWLLSILTLLIAPLITTHEPPSRGLRGLGFMVLGIGFGV